MTELVITGSLESALTHMALFGAAALLRGAGDSDVRIWFSNQAVPSAHLRADMDEHGIASALRSQAQTALGGWVGARLLHEGTVPRAVMSPRLKAPSSTESWQALQQARLREIDELMRRHSVADLEMIGGLGEPAYWRCGPKETLPDSGASRWEMKTRNKGEEFVGDRLSKLAEMVGHRDDAEIIGGLTGVSLVDETSQNSAASRTGTGFARPGPVDSALAWCALWGLSSFPVVHDHAGMSQTPGSMPRNRVHPKVLVLPVFGNPTALPRVRAVIRSAALDAYTGDADDLTSARRWLVEHGVSAVARFPVHVAGSSSAPERQILDATLLPLT